MVVADVDPAMEARLREAVASSIRRWAEEASSTWTRFVPRKVGFPCASVVAMRHWVITN